jgi:hypothetical protein
MPEETITIKLSYYKTLKRSHDLIMALQECGVDNWEGYSDAVNIAFPNEDEDEDEG